jgi:hypothetical protein
MLFSPNSNSKGRLQNVRLTLILLGQSTISEHTNLLSLVVTKQFTKSLQNLDDSPRFPN